ncbi:MAG: TerC family protein [Bacteroidia bacterium]|nr:TerC family protein [Bacteroidia bacterium]
MESYLDVEGLFTLGAFLSLITLALLEIVLGIDNLIFVAIVTGRLAKEKQRRARTLGLLLALFLRVALLFSITWIIRFSHPLFYISETSPFLTFQIPDAVEFYRCSIRDIILLGGGIFLLISATREIDKKIRGMDSAQGAVHSPKNFRKAIFQIMLIDVVFSFDSILTAIGLVNNVLIMIFAVIIAMIAMILFSGSVSKIINEYPTIKMLALAFLLMIGMVLIADGMHFHVPRGYVYFSVAFSLLVEFLNLRMKSKEEKRKSSH